MKSSKDMTTVLTPQERELIVSACETRCTEAIRKQLPRIFSRCEKALKTLPYRGQTTIAPIRRAMLKGSLRFGKIPAGWSNSEWTQVRKLFGEGMQFALIVIAFRGFKCAPDGDYNTDRNTPRSKLAEAIYGTEVFNGQFERVTTSLLKLGYVMKSRTICMRNCVADLLLYHQSPTLDVITDESLRAYSRNELSRGTRRYICTVSAALVELRIVSRKIVFEREPDKIRSFSVKLAAIDPRWRSSVDDWLLYSPLSDRTKRNMYGDLMQAGRWLYRYHPKIYLPEQWTFELAQGYVSFVDQAKVGELLEGPRPNLAMGEPLKANSKIALLRSIRGMFQNLQECDLVKKVFSPARAFRPTRAIMRSRQLNPRPIDAAVWMKLRTAALALEPSDLPFSVTSYGVQIPYNYPFEMVKALALTWVFSGCRQNEIQRLQCGCVYLQEVASTKDPETGIEQPSFSQYMLRVPVNKTRGEFVKPIEEPMAKSILSWEKVRPTQFQVADSTTKELVNYLFSFRGTRVGNGSVNKFVLPILLRRAGLPVSDSLGKITSHRARSTMASSLYNARSGLTAVEVMNWLGHTHFSSTQHYLKITPLKLITSFRESTKLTEQLRCISVLVDRHPEPNQPSMYYDLGHGWCTNDAYAACAHRMACAKCDFYVTAENFRPALESQSQRYVKMMQEVNLTQDEKAAVEGDADAVTRLLQQLERKPVPRELVQISKRKTTSL